MMSSSVVSSIQFKSMVSPFRYRKACLLRGKKNAKMSYTAVRALGLPAMTQERREHVRLHLLRVSDVFFVDKREERSSNSPTIQSSPL
jgi:hypothetical protein